MNTYFVGEVKKRYSPFGKEVHQWI